MPALKALHGQSQRAAFIEAKRVSGPVRLPYKAALHGPGTRVHYRTDAGLWAPIPPQGLIGGKTYELAAVYNNQAAPKLGPEEHLGRWLVRWGGKAERTFLSVRSGTLITVRLAPEGTGPNRAVRLTSRPYPYQVPAGLVLTTSRSLLRVARLDPSGSYKVQGGTGGGTNNPVRWEGKPILLTPDLLDDPKWFVPRAAVLITGARGTRTKPVLLLREDQRWER